MAAVHLRLLRRCRAVDRGRHLHDCPRVDERGGAARFVYGVIVSLFLFFNVFALVQWLQYRPVGRFRNYLTGEMAYIVLSLTAKSALAWQIFAGTLVG